jgi:hypothetical protein
MALSWVKFIAFTLSETLQEKGGGIKSGDSIWVIALLDKLMAKSACLSGIHN